MNRDQHQKVTDAHLQRDAYLYVRQSTLRQVLENTESTQRQYALRQQAVALGWPIERVIVIDSDQGQSGASVVDREGFQKLVTEVSLGRAGIVLGLEVSRLARNNADWHRLLEICALSDTLILDEDGLYDPGHFNDRLLLGLKGTMSEAELHVLRARLQGGIDSKARRGELRMPLPTGLVYDELGRVVLDSDRQVQQSLSTFFETFERTGTATATVKYFRREEWLFPHRIRRGLRKGELVWVPLDHARALKSLHNPRYAGAYFRGRTRTRKDAQGRVHAKLMPQDQWEVLLPNSHPGYITWEQYQRNQQRLRENSQAHGSERRKSPPGEGPALLQGLAICGMCGARMTVRYRTRHGTLHPDYMCQREGIANAEPICQRMAGATIDDAIGELLLELVTPVTLEVALDVQHQLESRLEEADRLRKQQVERSRYEADLAGQRFLRVDPNHRLVADVLEADWNEKLRALTAAQQHYEQQRQADQARLDQKQREQILSLASDFPRLWRDEQTPQRERKRMVRLLIEDVTLIKAQQLMVHVRLRGGTTRTLTLPLPLPSWKTWQTNPEIVAEIDRLLDEHPTGEIATRLNERGLRSGKGRMFTRKTIANICRGYHLKGRYERLRDAGLLTRVEIAKQLGIARSTVSAWRKCGLLKTRFCGDREEYLYEPLGEHRPVICQGRKLSDPRRFEQLSSPKLQKV
jgi:DNA invertase Pin-like site-specific DNA recombinase